MSRPVPTAATDDDRLRTELQRKALTSALYVSICLLAAPTAAGDEVTPSQEVVIVWGTSVGLALAHRIAFRVTAGPLTGRVTREDTGAVGYGGARSAGATRRHALVDGTLVAVVALAVASAKALPAGR